ncbi:MAG: PfkB family carbohydrate kinase [Proteobacteria bacterium]|nr:PfkB family carbohydrate kinase [Pseudomonadota bacterium]
MTDKTALPLSPLQPIDVLCIGSVLWDVIGRTSVPMAAGDDRPGHIVRQPGGVALNVAMALRILGLRPALLSALGQDSDGAALVLACQRLGLNTDYLFQSIDLSTDFYMAIEGQGKLIAAIADAHTLEAAGHKILQPLSDGRLARATAPWTGPIVLDGNLTEGVLHEIAHDPLYAKAQLFVAPASPGKAKRIKSLLAHGQAIFYMNLEEAGLMCACVFSSAADAALALIDLGARRALVTNGAQSCADALRDGPLLTQSPPQVPVLRVTGAGDTFMAAHIVAHLHQNDRVKALNLAVLAAAHFISTKGDF